MARVALVNPDTASDKQQELFTIVRGALGGVPNLFRAVANSPAALEGMLSLFDALGKTKIHAQLVAIYTTELKLRRDPIEGTARSQYGRLYVGTGNFARKWP
jgi:hypothetical protein